MKRIYTTLMVLFILPSVAAAQFDSVISVSPAVEGSCIAVEVPTQSMALSGLRWYHNDGTQVFPRVVIIEGEVGEPPDLTNPGLLLDEVVGVSAGWGELDLASPATSGTGTAFAVFFFPVGETTTSLGEGGGPGIGIREALSDAPSFYISADAVHWARISPDLELAVEPLYVALRGANPPTIAEIGVNVSLPEPTPEPDQAPELTITGMHSPRPNPFNPRVELSYSLSAPTEVQLRVYDVRGRLVKIVYSGGQSAGRHAVMWAGVDDQGRQVASGVYYARFEAAGIVQTQRLVLVR